MLVSSEPEDEDNADEEPKEDPVSHTCNVLSNSLTSVAPQMSNDLHGNGNDEENDVVDAVHQGKKDRHQHQEESYQNAEQDIWKIGQERHFGDNAAQVR